MLFRLRHPPLCFEIPDEWWQSSGAAAFAPVDQCYTWHAAPQAFGSVIASLDDVAPMLRRPGINSNGFGFRDRGLEEEFGSLPDVLRAMVAGISLPAVLVSRTRSSVDGFAFKVRNGFHRFYASHAVGFTHLPCGIVPDDRVEPQFGEAT